MSEVSEDSIIVHWDDKCFSFISLSDKGPSHWEGKCKEHRQSPIDIKSAKLTPSKELGEFFFRGYEVAPSNVTYQLVNNGHTGVY